MPKVDAVEARDPSGPGQAAQLVRPGPGRGHRPHGRAKRANAEGKMKAVAGANVARGRDRRGGLAMDPHMSVSTTRTRCGRHRGLVEAPVKKRKAPKKEMAMSR